LLAAYLNITDSQTLRRTDNFRGITTLLRSSMMIVDQGMGKGIIMEALAYAPPPSYQGHLELTGIEAIAKFPAGFPKNCKDF